MQFSLYFIMTLYLTRCWRHRTWSWSLHRYREACTTSRAKDMCTRTWPLATSSEYIWVVHTQLTLCMGKELWIQLLWVDGCSSWFFFFDFFSFFFFWFFFSFPILIPTRVLSSITILSTDKVGTLSSYNQFLSNCCWVTGFITNYWFQQATWLTTSST